MTIDGKRPHKIKWMKDTSEGLRQYLAIISHISDYDYPGERVYFLSWEICNEQGKSFIRDGMWPYPGGIRPTLKQLKIIMDLIETEKEWNEIAEGSIEMRDKIQSANRVMNILLDNRIKDGVIIKTKPKDRHQYKKQLYENYNYGTEIIESII